MNPETLRAAEPVDLLKAYRPPDGAWDEMVGSDGAIRPAWAGLATALGKLGPEELRRRKRDLEEQLRLNGVTYNVYDDSRGADRAWSLDPVPLVLESGEWVDVERGLIQRAELLDAVLKDIHGPRQLVREGLIPALFLYSHPGFQRACCGGPSSRQRMLHLYSADLARNSRGGFQVVSDRCQNPSGYGYALENRWVLSRTLPSLFRDFGVHRLPPFFQALRRCLLQSAPPGVQNPMAALLSPGPENETYFEQAYIASYLGLPLVRGGDLSVREDGLRLESLEGPRRVHVLLRRVDDAFCDPLELDGGSLLGVPGLVQAVRNRQVTVCNALGSGVLGGSGMMPFLPALSRRLFGQDLLLPSTPTWWLGDRAQQEEAMAHFDGLVIKPLYQGPKRSTWFVDRLGREQRERLLARIRARPHLYLAQERTPLSTAPCFFPNPGRLEPRAMVLRSFLAAVDGSYAVMPGGLTRVASRPGTADVTGQDGGISKDTWILASEPTAWNSAPELHAAPPRVNRQQSPLPGHSAENLFWMGRYQERLEGQVRLWRGVLSRLQDIQDPGTPAWEEWLRIIRLFQPSFLPDAQDARGLESALIRSLRPSPGPEGEAGALSAFAGASPAFAGVSSATIGPAYAATGSPAFNLAALRRSARAVRDLLPHDCWLAVHALMQSAPESQAQGEFAGLPPDVGEALRHLDRQVLLLGGLAGLEDEGISHGPIRRFIHLGRRLERAQGTARLLGAALGRNLEPSDYLLKALLSFHDSVATYRQRYQGEVLAAPVADLLVADEPNPRSIAYQLARLGEDLGQLPLGDSPLLSACEKTALKALTSVRVFEAGDSAGNPLGGGQPGGTHSRGGNEAFEHLMGRVADWTGEISDLLSREFFQAIPLPQPLREWN